jgi:hypothetical protein
VPFSVDLETETPEPTTDAGMPAGSGFTRHSIGRVTLLLVVLVVVTAAGIAAGRELKPAAESGPVLATTTAATSAPSSGTSQTTSTAPPSVPVGAAAKWGPLLVKPFGRFRPAGGRSGAALAGTTLVVAGGVGSDQVVAGPAGKTLGSAGTLPGPRAAPQVFTVGKQVYLLGGEDGQTPTAEIVRLAPAAGKVVPVGTFEEPLAEAGVAARGGSVYLAGGWTGQKYATAVLELTPPSTVVLVARLPVAVRSPAVALLRHTLYVVGGATANGLSKQTFAVDVDTGAVTTLDDLPQPVEQAVLLVSGTKLYLLGGMTASGKASPAIVAIDPATGQAAPAGRMPTPMAGAAAVPTTSGTLVVDSARGRVFRVG